ncbi:MAG TPA: DUF2905 domain-containing protein [Methylocystis sp.]|nr:DUF2905 domain-containing protein [Methylocystis sp.]
MPRLLILTGAVLILVGVVWLVGERLGLGRLPGDFRIEIGGAQIYVPLATSLLVSIGLSLVLWLFNR